MTHFKESGLVDRPRQDELLKVAEQAAAWLIELEEGGARERAACAAWLEESPLHVEMFLRASSVDRMMELMAPEDVKALAQRQLGDESAVIALPLSRESLVRLEDSGPSSVAQRKGALIRGLSQSWLRFGGLAAGVLVLIAGVLWYELFGPGAWESYETQVGEQRIVSLADGSVIYVNTDSRIDVRYSDTARDVRLRDGEALFAVEHDARRPFKVHIGNTIVRAVGTQFNVYRRAAGTKVAVVEGVVQVSQSGGESASTATAPAAQGATVRSSRSAERLAAGQGLSLGDDGALKKPVTVNVAQVTAWRQRRLVFEWQTLEEIATEFNHYNRAPRIRVEGDEVRTRRYTAVFDVDNPQALLRFLSKDDHLEFAAEGDDFVIRAR
jgi:transmembrane sensor